MNPEFFDIFGIIGFTILLFFGIKLFRRKNKTVKYSGLIITLISLIGLIVDLYIVLNSYVFN